jgi:hypothetical protein
VEKGGRKRYITDRNGRSFREQQGIVAFCTCQWNGCIARWQEDLHNLTSLRQLFADDALILSSDFLRQ